jgi:protoporphyrinogen oxidase
LLRKHKPHVIIIGAGISGLTIAYRLQQLLPDAPATDK